MSPHLDGKAAAFAPNLFIVGAPKCGTTALCTYLAQHPQVFISAAKEPHYYATDLPGLRYTTDYGEYLQLFSPAKSQHICRGEGSVYHLFSADAISNILEDAPDAHFVVMLRNPVDLVHALHGEHCAWLVEDVERFEDAWRLQEKRRCGQQIPKHCLDPRVLQYAEVGQLGTQFERLLQHVDQSRLKVVVFDEFARDTARVYAETLDFLGLVNDHRTIFPRVNEASRQRFKWLRWLTKRQKFPAWFTSCGRAIGLDKAYLWVRKVNSYPAQREPLSPELRAELCAVFRPEIDKLSHLLKRDFSHWYIPAASKS